MRSNRGVEAERLYQHVYELEGIRHPISNPQGLARALDYVDSQLQEIIGKTERRTFVLEGFDAPFANIEALLDSGRDENELLLTAHYDTRRNTPGADDNASALAILLEAARHISVDAPGRNVRFVGFTLEEGDPAREMAELDRRRRLGLIDDAYRYTSLGAREKTARSGARHDHEADVPDSIGRSGLIGSSRWIETAKATNGIAGPSGELRIDGVINLETVGYTSKTEHSQRLPAGVSPTGFPRHLVGEQAEIGDFLAIVSDLRSLKLGTSMFSNCADPSIDLPALHLAMPLGFDEIAKSIPDTLRSDHAPFWKAGIPALMLTDTAEFRNPFYHTPGDTIDSLDFDFMRRVCEAVVATIIDFER